MRWIFLVGGSAFVAASPSCIPRDKFFKNFVTFGDSYTDNGRKDYYIAHGHAPPPGEYQPVNNKTSSGGLAWGQYVEQMTGARYYDYAVGGASCSNDIVSRELPQIHAPFPSVIDDQIPSYLADIKFKSMYPDRTADNTANTFDQIHKSGGRHFFILNLAPLQLSPLYQAEENGGAGNNGYWGNKNKYDEVAYENKMMEYTTSTNTMIGYGVPFQLLVKKRWPGATFTIFDAHKLLTEIHNNPSAYLEAPASSSCYKCAKTDNKPESFMWYDQLHPSTKTDSVIAKHFVEAAEGKLTKYAVRYQRG